MLGRSPRSLPPADSPPRLAPPPRRVPLSLRARLLFGGFGVFAWVWFGFGSSMATFFLRHADLAPALVFREPLVRVTGVSLGCAKTRFSEGGGHGRRGTPIYANAYRFEADGAALEGVAHATGRCVPAGAAVSVEYRADDPAVSRIVGMRRAPFGPASWVIFVFPIVGAILVAASLRSGRRAVRLLERGRLALGTLLGEERTNVSINRRQVMKLRFAIETEAGARHEVVVKTHRTELLEDDPRERILYDPARPDDALGWDVLTCVPTIDAAGQLQPKGLVGTGLVLVPPAAAVVAHLLALGVLGS